MTDAEAMAALRAGDIAALDALVIRHTQRAQRIAYSVLRNPSATHDVVTESFLAVAGSARRYDPSRPFTPWFDRIVVNRAIREAQRELRRRRLATLWRRPLESEDPTHLAELHELRELLRRAFVRLNPRERAVVTMRLVLGPSELETAEALGCPVGTVKSRLARARQHLREDLADVGIVGAYATPIGENQ